MAKKKSILIIMGRYLPGYKDGGPVRSILNLTDYLGKEYDFKILTCDRDHGDNVSYPNIIVNSWNRVRNCDVYYVPPKGFKLNLIKRLSNEVDLVYVCGCFNDYSINTLIAKRFSLIKVPVVVAAMGLFSPLEFKLKYRKKKIFTTVFNKLGMFKKIYWSATSEMEILEIVQQVQARREQFFIAEDLPRKIDSTIIEKRKIDNQLEVVWISRIAPKKNLLGAIDVLRLTKKDIRFTIYGPVHENEYWDRCQDALNTLPPNVQWFYKGNLNSEDVVETLKEYHVFLFPTLGENYGHVIQEALSAGCMCVLSNQTPWQDLEINGAGYVFDIDNKEKFANTLDYYANMSNDELQICAQKSLKYAIDNSRDKVKNTGYRKIFEMEDWP